MEFGRPEEIEQELGIAAADQEVLAEGVGRRPCAAARRPTRSREAGAAVGLRRAAQVRWRSTPRTDQEAWELKTMRRSFVIPLLALHARRVQRPLQATSP